MVSTLLALWIGGISRYVIEVRLASDYVSNYLREGSLVKVP